MKADTSSSLQKQRMVMITVIFLFAAIGVVLPVTGLTPMPSYTVVNLSVANDAGARFDDYGNDTYNFFAATQSATQGLNALHLSRNNASNNYGDVTFSSAQSGVFYMTDTGGRGWDDDGVLMLAVNGTVPENFRLHLRASGYRWTPVPTGSYPPYSGITHISGTVDEYFTRDDFRYGPQIWKPCPAAAYPLYEGQDMADTANTFSILFIDLNAGILGSNALSQPDFTGHPVADNGSIRIEYSFENLQTFAAFNAYAYTVSSNQGQGIRWTNRVTDTGSSGFYVTGRPPVAPAANFTATPLSGTRPLQVRFTDTSTNAPTSWRWAYRNATTGWTQFATTKNPSFVFAAAGTYDINLTAANTGGSSRMTRTGYIRVTAPAPAANFTATPLSGIRPLQVRFTDTSTNAPTSWRWAYRNATTGWTQFANTKNPSFVFAAAGTYDINLTAANTGGSSRITRTGYIRVFSGGQFSMAGVFRNTTHAFILKNGTKNTSVIWGLGTDLPVAGDWNRDGLSDVGVFRPAMRLFMLKNGTRNTSFRWGISTDLPVSGDWNGDGLADVGVFRPSNHRFYLKNGTANTSVNWGTGTDLPVSGDWNGDGLADVGVFRPSNHRFYLKNGTANTSVNWGTGTDLPVSGDWNGDGLADVGVFRPSIHRFYLKNGTANTSVNWGLSQDKPVIGHWS